MTTLIASSLALIMQQTHEKRPGRRTPAGPLVLACESVTSAYSAFASAFGASVAGLAPLPLSPLFESLTAIAANC